MNNSQIREGYLNLTKIIRNIRESKSYSQEYVGAKLKISQNSYSKLELGYVEITIVKLVEIARVLEVDYLDLLRESFEIETEENQISA